MAGNSSFWMSRKTLTIAVSHRHNHGIWFGGISFLSKMLKHTFLNVNSKGISLSTFFLVIFRYYFITNSLVCFPTQAATFVCRLCAHSLWS